MTPRNFNFYGGKEEKTKERRRDNNCMLVDPYTHYLSFSHNTYSRMFEYGRVRRLLCLGDPENLSTGSHIRVALPVLYCTVLVRAYVRTYCKRE